MCVLYLKKFMLPNDLLCQVLFSFNYFVSFCFILFHFSQFDISLS